LNKLSQDRIGRVVATQDGPSFSQVDVRLEPGQSVKPGQLLFAQAEETDLERRYVVLRVYSAKETNPYETPLSSQVRDAFNMEPSRGREDLLRKFVVAICQPIELVNVKPDGNFSCEEPS
jgi:hypothetical protein